MDDIELIKALEVPNKCVDVVLDTDAYNEIDDQYAIAYMLKNADKLNCKAIYAAPFFNNRSTSPADGMHKSYDEILKVLDLCDRNDLRDQVFKGSTTYLKDEKTPVISEASKHLAALAANYSKENPLYVVEIAAITNVASAILLDPTIIDKIVIVWLGGHALEWPNNMEFNLHQDVAAARVVFGCKAPLVQLPCMGVVSAFDTTKPELEARLIGKNKLADYLARNTFDYMKHLPENVAWSRAIWDVTAVAWLLNEGGRFMSSRIIHAPIPEYDHHYAKSENTHFMRYVYYIDRAALFTDLFDKLTK